MSDRRRFGDSTVCRVTEQCGPGFLAEQLLPLWRPEMLDEMRDILLPHCFDEAKGCFIASIHTWVLRVNGRTILIDACTGDDKERPEIPRFHRLRSGYLDRLREAGVAPESVDFVLCTHLHADHCGWNTQLVDGRWVPTFPNARYLFSKEENDYWSAIPAPDPLHQRVYADSVLPVIEAAQTELVHPGDDEVAGGLSVHRTPGHSPGHLAFSLDTADGLVLFAGDAMHQPAQIVRPELYTSFCSDPDEAVRSRRWLLEFAAERRATVCTGHFAHTSMGHVARDGEGFSWRFK